MTDPFTSRHTYSQEANYGYTQQLPSQSSTLIQPVARSELTATHGQVGRPAEFVIKIDKLAQNERSSSRQNFAHNSDSSVDRSWPTTHYQHPSPPATRPSYQSQLNGERRRNYFTDNSAASDSQEENVATVTATRRTSSDLYSKTTVRDNSHSSSSSSSDEFKKKREKFLGITHDNSPMTKNGFHHGSLGSVAYHPERKLSEVGDSSVGPSGLSVGPSVGPSSGPSVGPSWGPSVGPSSGPSVGSSVGSSVGPSWGSSVGPSSRPNTLREFNVPIQREGKGDFFNQYHATAPGSRYNRSGSTSGEYIIPIQREDLVVPAVSAVQTARMETKVPSPKQSVVVPVVREAFQEAEKVPPPTRGDVAASAVTAPAAKRVSVPREEPVPQSFSSHRTVQTGGARKSLSTVATAPPVTRNWQTGTDQRGRSSSISSASSSVSLHSSSSADVPSKSINTAGKEAANKALLESRASSGHAGWVSPALVSRQVPGRKDAAGPPSRFSEAMARYKAQTEATPEGEETVTSTRMTERRGSKPLVMPVAGKTVHDKASVFEQKSQAPPASGLLSQSSRSMSQSALPTSAAMSSHTLIRDSFQNGSGRPQAKILISPSEEPDAEIPPAWASSKQQQLQQIPSPPTVVHTADVADQLKPVYQQDELSVARGSRDSGVSSRNSSVTLEHESMGPSDVFPPPLAEHIESFEESPKIPTPPPPPEIKASSHRDDNSDQEDAPRKADRISVPAAPNPPAADIKEPVRLTAPSVVVARSPSPLRSKKVPAAAPVPEASAEDIQQMIELAKSILGEDAATEEVLVIDLARPDGSTGGGVGMVLTGGADYEVNQIKVNKVISHSLAHRDGRVQAGDRLLLINGQSCSNMTHRQALEVLKAPRALVSLVLSRPANGVRREPSPAIGKPKSSQHAAEAGSRSLEDVSVRVDKSGLGLTIDGGHSDTLTDRPLTIRRISKGAISEPDSSGDDASHRLRLGDELVRINGADCGQLSRLDCTKMLKSIAEGQLVTLTVRR
ncbi:hypothetical protein BV898_03617 [Hypsibius exemplaris]|uniref:PDZ domain-containing protein n=1 Tax=Hypsibius exemplaris TaxID=2072580 RepID=A0A1W0X4I8_HYPEX|nr:hypothetical protein BV898_03617 [Hypsibius exemplaris]